MRMRRFVLDRGAEILAASGSALLSAVAVHQTAFVNNDGVWYLLTAEAYAARGFAAAQAIHHWPFYSILVSLLARAIAVSTGTAAHLLDAALLALVSTAFVWLVRDLGGDRRTELLAALVIVLHPGINRFRTILLRDFGLWCFALLALRELIRFGRTGNSIAAVRWALAGMAALVFRPEAVALLAVGPLSVLMERGRLVERARRAIRLVAVPALAATAGAAWLWSHPGSFAALRHGTLYLFQPMTGGFLTGAEGLAASFPTSGGREYAPYILLSGLLALPLIKVMRATGLAICLALVACPLIQARPPSRFGRRAVWVTVAAWAVPTYAFLFKMLFIETRYVLFQSLLISLWAPFALAQMMSAEARPRRMAAYALVALLAASALRAVVLPAGPQDHLLAAVDWLQRNTPEGSRLHTNSLQIAFYSRRSVNWEAVQRAMERGPVDGVVLPADYWAVRIAPGDSVLERTLAARPELRRLASFPSRQGEAVVLYRSTPPG
jgi:hypothetical protein